MMAHECVEKFYIQSTPCIVLLAMCKIKHWALDLNANTSLSFASCCISHLSLVLYYQCSIDGNPLTIGKMCSTSVCMYVHN